MKKGIYYIISLIFSFGLFACDEDYKDWADPQTNPQEEQDDVITFEATNSGTASFDLAEITAETIEIAKKAKLNGEGATVVYTVQIDSEESFANKKSYDATASGDLISITKSDLEDAVVGFYGRRPVARELFIRITATITQKSGTAYSAGSNVITIDVTPEAPAIETAYYLVGGMTGWNGSDVTTLLKFEHSGNDVYDDPYFTLLVNVSSDGGWKIVPQSAVTAVENGEAGDIWGAAMGTDTDGDTSLEGTFGSGKGGAMKIAEAGWAKITLDLMDYSYSVELIGEMSLQLYAPGGYQSWAPATAPIVYCKNYDMKYEGYINIAGNDWDQGFKFINGPDWPNAENGYRDYGTDKNGEPNNLMGGDNVIVTEEGYYRITVDLSGSEYRYSATKTDWFIVGDATPGGWDEGNATPLIFSTATGLWTVNANLEGGMSLKFMANKSWDINLGGSLTDLGYGGDNISITDSGNYDITLDLSDPKAYKATIVKK